MTSGHPRRALHQIGNEVFEHIRRQADDTQLTATVTLDGDAGDLVSLTRILGQVAQNYSHGPRGLLDNMVEQLNDQLREQLHY